MTEEFYISLIVIGGIVLAGSLIVIGLTIVAIAYFKKSKQTLKTNEKERSNGQHKPTITRGKW